MIYTKDGYIVGVSAKNNTESEQAKYEQILKNIKNKPTSPTGHDYRLKEDLTWELFEVVQNNEPEVSDSDYAHAGKILLGVSE